MTSGRRPDPATALGVLRGLARTYVPIVRWLPAYPADWRRRDLLAGLASWGVMVPVAMAYAELAGVPPEAGLTTAFAALAVYAILGTSRHLKVTTSSTMAVMSAAVVAPLAAGDPTRYLGLSAGLALVVGAILVAGGLVRMGFISDFLAKSVVTGFVFGLAITIIVGQLPKLFGVPGTSGGIGEQLIGLAQNLDDTNPWTLAVGLMTIGGVLLLRALAPRIPGALVMLVLGIVVSAALDLEAHGVSVVGDLSTGLPSLGLPAIQLTDLPFLALGAAGIVFLAVGESLGAARAFASRHGYDIDPDQELIALGGANVGSGLFGGFTVDASLSQSATGEAAGTKSQVSSLVTSALILATAVFLAPLFQELPNAVLAGILITAVLSLMDVAELRRFWALRRTDFLVALVAIIGVITTSVLIGMLIAVGLSLASLLYRASRPYVAVLIEVEGRAQAYADMSRHPEGRPVPGMLLLRLDAPLYFFNANVARSQVLALLGVSDPRPTVVVLDIGATGDLDTTTSDMLLDLVGRLRGEGVEVALAQVKGPVRDRMRRAGLIELIGEDRLFRTVGQAVGALAPDASTAGTAPAGDDGVEESDEG
jgi:high affinity sulfate transporter 1